MAVEKRKKVQAKSRELGHCVCTPSIEMGGQPCPCYELVTEDLCKCAGEQPHKGYGGKTLYSQENLGDHWRGSLRGNWRKMERDEMYRQIAAVVGDKRTPKLERITLAELSWKTYVEAFPEYYEDYDGLVVVHIEEGNQENEMFGLINGKLVDEMGIIECIHKVQERRGETETMEE